MARLCSVCPISSLWSRLLSRWWQPELPQSYVKITLQKTYGLRHRWFVQFFLYCLWFIHSYSMEATDTQEVKRHPQICDRNVCTKICYILNKQDLAINNYYKISRFFLSSFRSNSLSKHGKRGLFPTAQDFSGHVPRTVSPTSDWSTIFPPLEETIFMTTNFGADIIILYYYHNTMGVFSHLACLCNVYMRYDIQYGIWMWRIMLCLSIISKKLKTDYKTV